MKIKSSKLSMRFFTWKYNISGNIYQVSVNFLQIRKILFPFHIKKINKLKILKKIRNAKILPKNCQSGNTAEFWRDRKNGCRTRNHRPKINKVWLASDKVRIFLLLTSVFNLGKTRVDSIIIVFLNYNIFSITRISL